MLIIIQCKVHYNAHCTIGVIGTYKGLRFAPCGIRLYEHIIPFLFFLKGMGAHEACHRARSSVHSGGCAESEVQGAGWARCAEGLCGAVWRERRPGESAMGLLYLNVLIT